MPGSPSISNADGSDAAEAKKPPTVRASNGRLSAPTPGMSRRIPANGAEVTRFS
jgi:hypothetical protein